MISKIYASKQPLKIAFLGDSITEFGWAKDGGYVKNIINDFKSEGLDIIPIPAGACADTSEDVLLRIDKDVISYSPDIVFLMVGINDIYFKKVSLENYIKNLKIIAKKLKEKNIELILISITVDECEDYVTLNNNIQKYNKALENFAKENNILYIDVFTKLYQELQNKTTPDLILTVDTIHLNDKGNKILSDTIVESFKKSHKELFICFVMDVSKNVA